MICQSRLTDVGEHGPSQAHPRSRRPPAEIRSYPPPTNLLPSLASNTLLTLLALPNLTTLSWTRDKSLSTALLSVIARCMPNLTDLEINAHSSGQFDPSALVEIKGLKRMGLIMPDRGTVGVLGRWWERLKEEGGGLERLMIICQVRPSVLTLYFT